MSDPVPEVEFAMTSVIAVDDAAIARVRKAAIQSPKRRARLCLHPDSADPLHNMLIVLLRGTEIPIHRHPNKPECYHILSGRMSLIVCDDLGNELQRIALGPLGSDRSCLCRIAPGLWHRVEVETDDVVLHESTIGPFLPGDTEFLPRS